jgi:hypothetical protein
MTRQFSLFAALVSFAVAGSAFAAPTTNTPGIVDAYNAGQAIRADFNAGNVAQPAQQALNVLVEHGIELLVAHGDGQLADQLDREWNSSFQNYLPLHAITDSSGAEHFMDIGDHDALSPWLANFIQILNAKTKGILGGLQIVADINTMNYALAVVLHPKDTKWKSGVSQADEWEYRKHFIPMANIVTYWVTLETCNYVAKTKMPSIKKLCPKAATKLEFYMGRYWAPKISDFVYEKANGIAKKTGRLALSDDLDSQEFVLSEAAYENAVLSRF